MDSDTFDDERRERNDEVKEEFFVNSKRYKDVERRNKSIKNRTYSV